MMETILVHIGGREMNIYPFDLVVAVVGIVDRLSSEGRPREEGGRIRKKIYNQKMKKMNNE